MRRQLIEALRWSFVPAIETRGFEHYRLGKENSGDAAFRAAFPLGFFRRPSNGGFDLLDVQFKKHDRAQFLLNAGKIEADGIDLPWGHHIDAGSAIASDIPVRVRLFDGRVMNRWFGKRGSGKLSEQEANRIVERLLERFKEVENWFDNGDVGRHLRVIDLS